MSGARRIWPAEWERHDATWIAWPHHEPDWPGKLGAIPWVYAEIVRALHRHEQVEILCHDESVRRDAERILDSHGVDHDRYRLHIVPTDRVWLRDSAPTFAWNDGRVELINWRFNGWSKYDNYHRDEKVGEAVERLTGLPRTMAKRADDGSWMVLEGGGIETDGAGTMLVTEEWLLSDVQVRNPGMTREAYESAFAEYLGITTTIWLGNGLKSWYCFYSILHSYKFFRSCQITTEAAGIAGTMNIPARCVRTINSRGIRLLTVLKG